MLVMEWIDYQEIDMGNFMANAVRRADDISFYVRHSIGNVEIHAGIVNNNVCLL